MPYIRAEKPADGQNLTFSELPKLGDDRAALIVMRGEFNYLLMNKFPYNAGHLMALPYRAAAGLDALSAQERADLMEMILKGQQLLQRALEPDGFNIGFNFGRSAGAGIPNHLHCHIVPRWGGDTNFMPVLANTRVLPEALDKMWEHLTKFA